MNNLNLDILVATPRHEIIKDLNLIFSVLLNEIHHYLGLGAVNQNVELRITDTVHDSLKRFIDLGVKRRLIDNQYQIEISEKYLKFIQFVLLREAYLCFIPNELKKKEIIQIVISKIIESDLSKLESLNQWKRLIRSKVVNYEYLLAQFDKLNKFFKLEGTENTQSPTQFIFDYIRRNVPLIQDRITDFYEIIVEDFIYTTSKSLYNDEILETIRVVMIIFSRVKLFRQFNEFEEYFQKFKEKGIISTYLSKRQFSENLRWISRCTYISPNFNVNYHKINLVVISALFKFNPILRRKDIYNVIKRIPFLRFPVFTSDGFSEEIYCIFVIPKLYLKDLVNFINNLYNFRYIVNKNCYIWKTYNNIINLNYFREYFKDFPKIINPDHKFYQNQFELFNPIEYGEPYKEFTLTLLDWIILERVRETSLAGFGFERRIETLQSLKDEMLNYIESEKGFITNLKSNLNVFYESPYLKTELLDFLKINQNLGFFYIDEILYHMLANLDLIEEIIRQHSKITNIKQLREIIGSHYFSQVIEEQISVKNKDIQKIIFRDLIPLYFTSPSEFEKEKAKYQHFYNLFESCRQLKIYSFNMIKEIVKHQELAEMIYKRKEKKLRHSFEKFKPYKITNQRIDTIFTKFINIELIIPELVSTITTSSFAKYHPIIILKDTSKVYRHIGEIIKLFPRVLVHNLRNIFDNESVIILFAYFLNIKEKQLFLSILFNLFKKDLINFKRYFTSGLTPYLIIKNFYDYEKKEFFYAQDLFEQSVLYIQNVFGDVQNPLLETRLTSQEKFWSKNDNIFTLIEEVDNRVSYEQPDFNINKLNELYEFNRNLNTILLNPERFKASQQTQFFQKYIKAIKFTPNLQAFGLGQFYLYIHPSDIDKIDFKHLLINSFQSIKYPTIIDDSNSFLIKYIFPYHKANMKHINWYTKTKHIIREYCLFSVKTIYQILNFNYNLSASGWNYDSNRFKIFMQNILFNPKYNVKVSNIKQFNLGRISGQKFIGPDSMYFQALVKIHTWKSTNLKSIMGSTKYSIIDKVTKLINKKLIFPYILLKNLDFQDKIYIILPNVKHEFNQVIVKIFNFFNYGFIYVIEGEYYIHGFPEEIKFENGLMIKLHLPQCEVDEFLRLFDLLFKYLEINNYIILMDLVDGKSLLKEIYGNLEFLDSYNPLINLKWNDKDKIWMNHKLYTEMFELLYPDLLYGKKIVW